jgi:hypothetical protein
MDRNDAARHLAKYIQALPDFIYHEVGDSYGHIGATIADAVLQAQKDYDAYVTPRTTRILKRWPHEKTITPLLNLLVSVPATEFLNCKDSESSKTWLGRRVERFCAILHLLKREKIESEADLKAWLAKDNNLPKLHAIRGVGPKTVDYLKILVGLQSAAIDGRLRKFLGMAGITTSPNEYDTAKDIVNRTADLLSVERSLLDHSIWRYIGDRQEGRGCA